MLYYSQHHSIAGNHEKLSFLIFLHFKRKIVIKFEITILVRSDRKSVSHTQIEG